MESISKIRRMCHVQSKGFKMIARELKVSKNMVKRIIREDITAPEIKRGLITIVVWKLTGQDYLNVLQPMKVSLFGDDVAPESSILKFEMKFMRAAMMRFMHL